MADSFIPCPRCTILIIDRCYYCEAELKGERLHASVKIPIPTEISIVQHYDKKNSEPGKEFSDWGKPNIGYQSISRRLRIGDLF